MCHTHPVACAFPRIGAQSRSRESEGGGGPCSAGDSEFPREHAANGMRHAGPFLPALTSMYVGLNKRFILGLRKERDNYSRLSGPPVGPLMAGSLFQHPRKEPAPSPGTERELQRIWVLNVSTLISRTLARSYM